MIWYIASIDEVFPLGVWLPEGVAIHVVVDVESVAVSWVGIGRKTEAGFWQTMSTI